MEALEKHPKFNPELKASKVDTEQLSMSATKDDSKVSANQEPEKTSEPTNSEEADDVNIGGLSMFDEEAAQTTQADKSKSSLQSSSSCSLADFM